ncbi:hypothetical protein [Streptomyces sp. NPDC001809]
MSDVVNFSALFAGARKFANSAMEANAESDLEVFLLHAGVSIERLAKATLVDQNPVLLLEMKGKEESLFHLAGVKAATRLRTIGAAVALSRLRSMGVLPPKDEVLDELIELRNGVAHLSGGAEETFEGLAAFVRTTNTLLTHRQKDAGEYWGRWQGAVDIALSEHMEKVEREIAGRIESARYRLSKRMEGCLPRPLRWRTPTPVTTRMAFHMVSRSCAVTSRSGFPTSAPRAGARAPSRWGPQREATSPHGPGPRIPLPSVPVQRVGGRRAAGDRGRVRDLSPGRGREAGLPCGRVEHPPAPGVGPADAIRTPSAFAPWRRRCLCSVR